MKVSSVAFCKLASVTVRVSLILLLCLKASTRVVEVEATGTHIARGKGKDHEPFDDDEQVLSWGQDI